MITTKYKIEGMTCMGCINSVKRKLESIEGIDSASIQLDSPQATLVSNVRIPLITLQNSIGKYNITKFNEFDNNLDSQIPEISLSTYKPLILIVLFLSGIAILAQFPFSHFSFNLWMRHFMAGFFIAFSFFKFLNLSGFANSFAMYDIIAIKWKEFGYIYPFIELILGISYLLSSNLFTTNFITIIVLGTGTIGVVKSNLSQQKIKCACLGDIFNLPMSKVTIIENLTMIIMAFLMML